MTVIQRSQLLIVAFLSISVLFIITKSVSNRDHVLTNEYISQFIVKQSEKVATEEEAGATESFFNSSSNMLTNTDQTSHKKSHLKPNLTVTFFKTEDKETTIKFSISNEPRKMIKRNVFVKMKYINKSSENMFFIESRCSAEKMAIHFKGNRGFVLNARQCCAIESTAQMNLDLNVYIFHSCPLDDDFFQHSPRYVQHLFKYQNIYVVRLNASEVLLGSPLEDLYRKKLVERSKYPVEHTSDLLRVALLWRFGGTYSDLDVVTIRPFNNLGTNWAGMQDDECIASGVMNFEPEGVGHNILQRALEHVNKHYDPYGWASNGPLLITPVILEECKAKTVPEAQKHCNGSFNILNTPALYPLYYTIASQFFDNHLGDKIVSIVKNESVSVHIWNKITHNLVVTVGSNQAYALLADEYCPQVYRNCGTTF